MRLLLVTVFFAGAFAVVALLLSPVATPRVGPIVVTATLTGSTTRAVGPIGKIADSVEQKFRVNDRNGRPIGRLLLACRWVATRNRLCNGELKMPLGKITMAGSSFTSLAGQYAVTGGTDLYDDAGGVLVFTSISRGKLILFVNLT